MKKKDLDQILKAKKYFEIIIQRYPNTPYASDSIFKLEYILELMASKEMYLARYYVEREKWIPAINRFKIVVKEYETTIYVEEALHRLVEAYTALGVTDEARKVAAVLGYNYPGSVWYLDTYAISTGSDTRKESEKEGVFARTWNWLF